ENATGSGMHTHLSLWRDGKSLMGDAAQKWGLHQTANRFMAGVFRHLPALMAVTTPSVNSYRRIRPHAWSGAYQAWGIANKEAAIRLILEPKTSAPIHFELKTMDASANPYLALGNILAAGLDGIKQGHTLPEPVEVDPGNFSTRERDERGIRALPTNLESSLENFVADNVLREAMQPAVADAFVAVRRTELEALHGHSFEDERLLLLERY
ncbi:MAG: glutamine synthetase, partial [Gemmataceae bacterium]